MTTPPVDNVEKYTNYMTTPPVVIDEQCTSENYISVHKINCSEYNKTGN